MKVKNLFLLPALALFANATLQAQVTIGGVTNPTPGAILDLNSTGGAKGGMLLSNVNLEDLTTIPETFIGMAGVEPEEAKTTFMGAIVYHTGGNDIPAGIYVWDGHEWVPSG
jgi:hypothetical protein